LINAALTHARHSVMLLQKLPVRKAKVPTVQRQLLGGGEVSH
jgi:hypothetical protein